MDTIQYLEEQSASELRKLRELLKDLQDEVERLRKENAWLKSNQEQISGAV